MSADTNGLRDRVYRNPELRERVKAEMRKRSDTAENGLMLIIAEMFVNGVRDGNSFGLDMICREGFTE